jgi:predicted amidophosphoribosyltransferase
MAQQLTCERCKAPLDADAAYCFRCGERTRRAKRIVRVAIRVEILMIALMFALVIGFAGIYLIQR